jgi:hypothetical protein
LAHMNEIVGGKTPIKDKYTNYAILLAKDAS